MVAPATRRPGKYLEGVIQIHVTRACDMACPNCTQGSQYGGRVEFMPLPLFETALRSLVGYFGVVGLFGGNPALHPNFDLLCDAIRRLVPAGHRGIWCNHPRGKAALMAATFDAAVSNLNCHGSQEAFDEFKAGWPQSRPFLGPSRHAPVFVSMVDLKIPEAERWELISQCPINRHWSAGIGVFRGELRAWFCEVAMAQSILHQFDDRYPDTGLYVTDGWWRRPMTSFAHQVDAHCHGCGVPLDGEGVLDTNDFDQFSLEHEGVALPKRRGRRVQLVTLREQVGKSPHGFTFYLQNAH
jgi:hypothetical protein